MTQTRFVCFGRLILTTIKKYNKRYFMITKGSLEKAAEKNIIQPEQIEPLYQFLHEQPADTLSDNREEPLRFIRSFGDVFITVGVIFLMISINLSSISGLYYLIPAAGFVVLAEWLVRIRRLALPGMAILLSILYFVYRAITHDGETTMLLGLSIVAVTSLLFYFRYKMPFSHLPLAASLVAMFIIMIDVDAFKNPIVFAVSGLIVFAVAMWFDSRDTERVSHLSDSAFWLHLLASPLLVHGLMLSMLTSEQAWAGMLSKEIMILCFFAVFFLTALLVDRRAMLISTQLYMIYAVTQILRNSSANAEDIIIFVFIGLGIFVIYFGAYWYKSRRFIFGFLSGKAITRYIPELNIQDSKAKV